MKVLKVGMSGKAVEQLQTALNKTGKHSLSVDGNFGPKTLQAVIKHQKDNNLVADGIVGNRTWATLVKDESCKLPDYLLKESDLVNAARELQIELNVIKAFSEVESGGNGFFEPGKPAILYERHIFRRIALQRNLGLLVELASASRDDLVNSKVGGYRGGKHEYVRLHKAMELNPEIALESCSWGRYQIMGMHWKALGYNSIHEFHDKMKQNEGEHLIALVRFIQADSRLHQAMMKKDWATCARIYNGPNHQQYDVKLKVAYDRLSSK